MNGVMRVMVGAGFPAHGTHPPSRPARMPPLRPARRPQAIGNEMDVTLVDLDRLLPPATVMVVTVTATTTSGKPLSQEDLKCVCRCLCPPVVCGMCVGVVGGAGRGCAGSRGGRHAAGRCSLRRPRHPAGNRALPSLWPPVPHAGRWRMRAAWRCSWKRTRAPSCAWCS